MTKTSDDPFAGIEQNQAALRESIEQAKALAMESERRIRPSREERPEDEPEPEPEPEPPNPA